MVGNEGFVSLSSPFSLIAAADWPLLGDFLLVRPFVSPAPSPPDLAKRCASALCRESDAALLAAKFLVRAIFGEFGVD